MAEKKLAPDQVEDKYSTTEIKTGGIWIDGKPIYRRVFQGTMVNNGAFSTYEESIPSSIEVIVNHHAFIKDTSSLGISNVPFVDGGFNGFTVDNQVSIRIDLYGNNFVVFSSGNTEPSPVYVVIEYTKSDYFPGGE